MWGKKAERVNFESIWIILTGIASTAMLLFFNGTEFAMLYEFGDVSLHRKIVLDEQSFINCGENNVSYI